jgi:predicted heme/steroid binding protein
MKHVIVGSPLCQFAYVAVIGLVLCLATSCTDGEGAHLGGHAASRAGDEFAGRSIENDSLL